LSKPNEPEGFFSNLRTCSKLENPVRSAGAPPITRAPLNVFLTIDTEFSPRDFHAHNGAIAALVDRDIDGITPEGRFGIGYQMDRLEAHGLTAVFQVEALSASAIGMETLKRVVAEVQSRGHEIQLHVHAEWLGALTAPDLPKFRGRNLVSYTEDEQARIIGRGLRNLRDAGAKAVTAFRAGNYGANRDTLRAVARNGLVYDTSLNVCYLDPAWNRECGSGRMLTRPALIEGVREIPISFFVDWPGHCRPAQLCACSSAEMKHALDQAWTRGWSSFVIVSHSFELIRRPKTPSGPTMPDRLVIRRMEQLCAFLAAHPDKFRCAGFGDVDPATVGPPAPEDPLRSNLGLTMARMAQQLSSRWS
jgi:hypothetical protein